MAARTMEEMPDCVGRDQSGLRPFHLDVASRANWRIQVIECALNLVDHYRTVPVFRLFKALHDTNFQIGATSDNAEVEMIVRQIRIQIAALTQSELIRL